MLFLRVSVIIFFVVTGAHAAYAQSLPQYQPSRDEVLNAYKAATRLDTLARNAILGDFTDKNNGDDYGYDVNGNMIVDLNKKMTGTPGIDQTNGAIIYNHLNLPWKIQVDGGNKGTITYTYDAAGVKISKVVEDKSVAGKTITTTTSYVGGLVYESKVSNPAEPASDFTDKLQFISHEEGRIRYIPAGVI